MHAILQFEQEITGVLRDYAAKAGGHHGVGSDAWSPDGFERLTPA